jgi:hypothetical protein
VVTDSVGVAGFTVSVSEGEVTDPSAAVIAAVPTATPVARPWVPAVLLMVATAVFAEVQVTDVVRI